MSVYNVYLMNFFDRDNLPLVSYNAMRNFEMQDVQRNTDYIHKKEQKRSFCVFFFGGGSTILKTNYLDNDFLRLTVINTIRLTNYLKEKDEK